MTHWMHTSLVAHDEMPSVNYIVWLFKASTRKSRDGHENPQSHHNMVKRRSREPSKQSQGGHEMVTIAFKTITRRLQDGHESTESHHNEVTRWSRKLPNIITKSRAGQESTQIHHVSGGRVFTSCSMTNASRTLCRQDNAVLLIGCDKFQNPWIW